MILSSREWTGGDMKTGTTDIIKSTITFKEAVSQYLLSSFKNISKYRYFRFRKLI